MASTYGTRDPGSQSLHLLMSQIHQTLGLLLFAAMIFRLIWRRIHGAPALPAATPRWQTRSAKRVQAGLYILLLALPLAGWAALSSLADIPAFGPTQIWFFGHDGFGPNGVIPRIVAPVPYDGPEFFSYSLFAATHRWLAYMAGAFLLLHILGALWHHYIAKDDVLLRMIGRNQ